MKDFKLNIPLSVQAEWLRDVSCYSEDYYYIKSCSNSCSIQQPFNIIKQVYNKYDDCYEYSLGYFEREDIGGGFEVEEFFVEVFSWTVFGKDSIFDGL